MAVIQEDGQSELLAVCQDCGSLGKIGPRIRKTIAFSGLLSVSYELVKMNTICFMYILFYSYVLSKCRVIQIVV